MIRGQSRHALAKAPSVESRDTVQARLPVIIERH
jgi:hypothetical protein